MAWRNPWRRGRKTEVSAEIDAHIRMAIQDRLERGESPEEARRNAHLEFGSVRLTVEDARGEWGWTRLEQLWLDVRSGARILTSAPGISLSSIALIALVIGGNTTIYSAVHGMLSKPAPGVDARGLVSLGWTPGFRGFPGPEISLDHFEAGARGRHLRTAAFRTLRVAFTNDAGTYAARAESISPSYFETLGVHLAHGRTFSGEEARLGPAGLLAILSERFSHEHFGGAERALGRTVAIDGHPATVIGIAPSPFQGAWTAESTDIWVPMRAFARVSGSEEELDRLGVEAIVGRLAPGSTFAEAEAEQLALAAGVPVPSGTPANRPVMVEYTGTAARNNQIARMGPRFLTIFSIVTVLTVIIVCANVANLMLARAMGRQREMAVRQSFGASRWRITRLVVAEGLTLALAAWAVACLFAYWVAHGLRGFLPPSQTGNVQVLLDFRPDWQVLAYAMLLAVAAALAFTVVPAVRTWRQDLLSYLKAGERGIVQGRTRATRLLVVLQLALSVVLLVGAGLGYRSLSLVSGAELGFESRQILLATVDLSSAVRTNEAAAALIDAMVERVRGSAGVESAAVSRHTPDGSWPLREIRATAGQTALLAERNDVGPGYLDTLGLALLAGKDFSRTPNLPEAIINRHLADALWPGQSAVGRTMLVDQARTPAVIVGVAPNALLGGYRREARPYIALLPLPQGSGDHLVTLYVKYQGTLDTAVPTVTRALRDTVPAAPVMAMRTLDDEIDAMMWTYRTLTRLLVMFAAGSLFIAALGQYAAMSFAMRQRIRDFAIRMAMGASSRQILTWAMREGLILTAMGLTVGLALGVIAGRAGRSLLHGVTPTDTATYAGVLLVLGAASLSACYLPALRASRVNPVDALRNE